MPVIMETRYRGTWEGGPWAAFDVDTVDAIPGEAFAGDPLAAEWWMAGPSVLVGVGDNDIEALSHLEHVQRQAAEGVGRVRRYPAGLRVGIARCAPDSMRADDWSPMRMSALVRDAQLEPNTSRFGSALPAQWIYLVEFDDALTSEVPEPYLRFVIPEWPGHLSLA